MKRTLAPELLPVPSRLWSWMAVIAHTVLISWLMAHGKPDGLVLPRRDGKGEVCLYLR